MKNIRVGKFEVNRDGKFKGISVGKFKVARDGKKTNQGWKVESYQDWEIQEKQGWEFGKTAEMGS